MNYAVLLTCYCCFTPVIEMDPECYRGGGVALGRGYSPGEGVLPWRGGVALGMLKLTPCVGDHEASY